MIQFLVRRLIGLVFIVIGITFITFMLGYFSPGDPIRELLGEHFHLDLYLQLKHSYGLDLPWYQQYFNFLSHFVRLDFGTSFRYPNRPVWDLLKDGVPISVELAMWGTLITLILGIPVGIWSALKANTWGETTVMGFSLVLYALPSFILAVLAQVFIVWLNTKAGVPWPVTGWGDPWQYSWDDIQHRIIPVLVYAGAGYAFFSRLARTSMLEVLRQDYVRTARAKGLKETMVVYRHALRNALIPLITVIGFVIGTLVAGSFFIERIFSIQGIAAISVNSIFQRDYPVIQATTIMIAVGVVLGNLLSDILYTLVDPRIKSE